jgi:hypothetical protein
MAALIMLLLAGLLRKRTSPRRRSVTAGRRIGVPTHENYFFFNSAGQLSSTVTGALC